MAIVCKLFQSFLFFSSQLIPAAAAAAEHA